MSDATAPGRVPLREIAWVFGQIGALSFGGGVTAWIYREVVTRRGWLTDRDLLSGLTLGQILPGVNVTNLSLYVGFRLRGMAGALTAIVSLIFVPFFAIIGLAGTYATLQEIPGAGSAMVGVASGAAGLLVAISTRSLRRSGGRPWRSWAIALFIMLTAGFLNWPMIPVVLGIAPVSIIAAWFERRHA